MPATTPITATYDAGITAALSAMVGPPPSGTPTVVATGAYALTAYALDINPGCLADVIDLAVSVDADLTGIAPGDVATDDGFAIAVLDWDGASFTPLDGSPTVISGDDLAGVAPGFGMIGRWYTGVGGTVPSTSTPTVTGVWSGTPTSQAIVIVLVDLDQTAAPGGTLKVDAPTVSATFTPGSPCAAVVPGGYRPPVKRYPARADRPSSIVGDRSAFRRR